MGRLKCLLLAGALAVAVAAMAAGPASAAEGGNSANAHACQHGGHETLFEGETGAPFKNTGDCASHGARGGTVGLAGQAACARIGGRFAAAPGAQNAVWQCDFPVPPNDAVPVVLSTACGVDAGPSASFVSISFSPGTRTFLCLSG
jgi:hypothetical protein